LKFFTTIIQNALMAFLIYITIWYEVALDTDSRQNRGTCPFLAILAKRRAWILHWQ